MKKIIVFISALTMAIGLSACSGTEDAKTDKKEATETKETAAPKVDVKKELVKFYVDLGKKINAKDGDLNAYVAKASKEDPKPEDLPTVEEKTAASESAAAVAAELSGLQIPETLANHKADLEAALKDYAAAYQAKADELKKDVPALDAGDDVFAQGEEKLGKLFEAEKLMAPSLGKQVN